MYDLHKEHLVVFIKNHHGDPNKRREYLKRKSNYSEREIEEEITSMNTYKTVLEYASPTKPYQIPYLIYQNRVYRIEYYNVWDVDKDTQVIMEKLRAYLYDPYKTLVDMNNEFRVIHNKIYKTSEKFINLISKRKNSTFPLIPFDYNLAFVDDIFEIQSPVFDSVNELCITDFDKPQFFPSYFYDFVDTKDKILNNSQHDLDAESLLQKVKDTPGDRLKYIHDLVLKGDKHIRRRIWEYNTYIKAMTLPLVDDTDPINFNFKLAYYVSAYQYVYFPCYSNAIKKLSAKNNVLHAKEIKGFDDIERKLPNNIHLNIQTNFSFGNSAQFHTQLYYKGVLISLFSYLLEYAYLLERGYEDLAFKIVKYTKFHAVKRNAWEDALNFAKEVYETVQNGGEEAFVNKYIVGEINKFLEYFEELKKSRNFVKEHYFQKQITINGKNQHIINKAEIERYIAKEYLFGRIISIRAKDVLPIVYKCNTELTLEKYNAILDFEDSLCITITAKQTTSAISFVQKLRKYNTIIPNPKFKEAENRIYEMNREFKVLYLKENNIINEKLRYIEEFLTYLNNTLNTLRKKVIEKGEEIQQFVPSILPKLKSELIKLFETDERIRTIYTSDFEVGWCTSVMLNDATSEVKTIEGNINQMVGEKQKIIDAKDKLEREIRLINAEISFLSTYKDVYSGFLGTLQECIAKINF